MASTLHTERRHRRTVLTLTLACAVTWLFAIGHALPGVVGEQPALAAPGCQTAERACLRASAPRAPQALPAGATTAGAAVTP